MRQIYIVNATQVVTSESHPEGLFSVVQGFPQNFDSQNYADEEAALRAAKSAYYARLSANYGATNRAMTTMTLTMSDGRIILRDSEGAFPVIEDQDPPEAVEA